MINYYQNTTLVIIGPKQIILLLKYKKISNNVIILIFTFDFLSIWVKQLKDKCIEIQTELLFCLLICNISFSRILYSITSLNLKEISYFHQLCLNPHEFVMDPPECVKRKSPNHLENGSFQAVFAILPCRVDLNAHTMFYGSGDGSGPSSCGNTSCFLFICLKPKILRVKQPVPILLLWNHSNFSCFNHIAIFYDS